MGCKSVYGKLAEKPNQSQEGLISYSQLATSGTKRQTSTLARQGEWAGLVGHKQTERQGRDSVQTALVPVVKYKTDWQTSCRWFVFTVMAFLGSC